MGIQYVTVNVNTSGLYQPLASATGIVGIIGPAPSAGTGFSNPTLFTRPLTGAPGEPYATVVPVLAVAPVTSDVQTLSIAGGPTGGSFTLTFDGQTTGPIAYNATAAQVQAALVALSNIGANNVVCAGGPLPAASITMTFTAANALLAQPPIVVGASNLTGGAAASPTIAHTITGSLVSDVQTLSLSGNPNGGAFALSFGGQTTAPIAFNASAAQVQAALTTLPAIGAGNLNCSGGPLPAANVAMIFVGGLATSLQPEIDVATNTLTNASSPVPTVQHTTTGAAVADVQTLSVAGAPTGGSFTLTFGGQTTAAIPFNTTAVNVQGALTALSSIGAGNVVCAGGPLPASSVTVTFAGRLAPGAQQPIALGANNLTGGTNSTPAIAHTTTGETVADVQTLSIANSPTNGSFTLTFGGQTTTAIPFNSTAAQVQAALTALSTIGTSNGTSNVVCAGGPLPGSNVTITFAGSMAPGAQGAIALGTNVLTSAGGPAPTVAHTTPGRGVAQVAVPVDADNNPIVNLGWDPVRFQLIDTTLPSPQNLLTVDTATRSLSYSSTGAAFQDGGENAVIALQGFSTVTPMFSGSPPYWGAPLDSDGQPVLNLLMRPDVAPAQSFVDFAANALTLDGTTPGVANGGTGKPKAVGSGAVYYKVTFDICALATSINLALTNGAIQVWGYRLDPAQQPPDFAAAFTDFSNRQINIVCLSSDSNPDDITALKNHVESSSPNDAGGGGARPRIGVAMLPMGGITDAKGNLTNKFSDWKTEEEQQNNLASPMNWSSSRMAFVVANSPDDIASAAAGVIAGVDPWVSLILKQVAGIGVNGDLTDQAISVYLHPDQSNLVAAARHSDRAPGISLRLRPGHGRRLQRRRDRPAALRRYRAHDRRHRVSTEGHAHQPTSHRDFANQSPRLARPVRDGGRHAVGPRSGRRDRRLRNRHSDPGVDRNGPLATNPGAAAAAPASAEQPAPRLQRLGHLLGSDPPTRRHPEFPLSFAIGKKEHCRGSAAQLEHQARGHGEQ